MPKLAFLDSQINIPLFLVAFWRLLLSRYSGAITYLLDCAILPAVYEMAIILRPAGCARSDCRVLFFRRLSLSRATPSAVLLL